MSKLSYGAIILFVLTSLVFNASLSSAECTFQTDDDEYGILGGYGHNFATTAEIFKGKNVTEDVQFLFLIPYWGKVLTTWSGCSNLEFMTEGFLSYANQESESRYAAGITPFFQLNFNTFANTTPFIGIGAGIVFTDLDPEGFGANFNFTPQAGAGIRYKLERDKLLIFSYRYHHISNAGTESPNESIDSNFFILGLASH